MGAFSRAKGQARQAAAAGLYNAGRKIMSRSDELVPIDTGTLRASGRTLLPEEHGDTITVTCGYGYGTEENPETGDVPAGYAIYVHERTELRHEPPRQAKFLETAALELAPDVPAEISIEIQKAWKKGVGRGDHRQVIG